MKKTLVWSEAVNRSVADMVKGVPPFPYVRESLDRLMPEADMVVVSSTPAEALIREWEEHDIARYTRVIAGQEMGSKKEKLAAGTEGRYRPDHILMIGDAPGDLEAAKKNNALFYPIIPGQEESSWEKFYNESLDIFLSGEYQGKYEDALLEEFLGYLPEVPPWKK